jgi:hypothetical protein
MLSMAALADMHPDNTFGGSSGPFRHALRIGRAGMGRQFVADPFVMMSWHDARFAELSN